jgi:hypothetical protein
MDPGVRELAALSALAALGCGLATAQGDLWFVVIFGAAKRAKQRANKERPRKLLIGDPAASSYLGSTPPHYINSP